jgi:rhodanese-related sulfurtransferase
MNEVTVEEAFAEISSGRAIGIDVRESDEWVAGHATNVQWNPMSEFNFSALSPDLPIIFICRSGARSGKVAESLSDHTTKVFNMTGGMKVWLAAGLPMECDSGVAEVI